MAIRVATTTGETRAISIREAISTTETRAISIREAISASETREILGQAMAAPATFFDTLITRADVLTASEFNSRAGADAIKYSQNGGNIGTLLHEYAAAAPDGAPMFRRLRHSSDDHIEIRGYGGDLTSRGGINYTAFPGWGNWLTAIGSSADHGLYVIDLDLQQWFAINPHNVNSRSGGGSWANWSDGIRLESWASSFANNSAAANWVNTFRLATSPRHLIGAVLNNHDYVPTF